jgi:hypothetical protein
MPIKLKRDAIKNSNFLTRREEKTGNVKVVISPNKFQVGLSQYPGFQPGMCVYGPGNFYHGLSGSLTHLTDGTSYLIAGSNVTVTTGANGSITISSTGGGAGSPGGSNTDVQFNDGGSFGGDSDFTYDKTLNELTLSGTLKQLTGSFYSTNYAGNVNLRAPFDLATELNFTLPEADGTKFQFMQTDSAGNLSFDFSDRVYFNVRNQSGADLQAGTPVYVIGYSAGNDRAVIAASSASVAATMPAVGVLAQNLSNNSNGKAVAIGILEGVNTVSFSEGDALYVGDGVLQNTKPTGFNDLIQNAAFVLESAANGTLNVKSPGRTNDVPNIVNAIGGFSGSLTTLTDGTSYLIAGTSIDISSQSNGPVTISTTNVTASYVSSSVIEGGTVGEILAVNGSGVSEFTHNIVDATNTISLATLARYAYDGSGIISLDWGGRTLQYSNGANASDWSTDNFLQVTGTVDISGSLEVFTEESAIIINAAAGGATDGRHIYIDAGGFNPPTTTNRSDGTKIVLYPGLGASTTDYGVGVEDRSVWFSTARALSTYGFKWYGSTTRIAELDGTSTFFLQEKASITHLPDAGQGAFWVKNDTPNVPYFTDDAGTDHQLAYVGAGTSVFFDSTTAGSIFTTGSTAFVGAEGIDSPTDKGTDVFFYVSGALDGTNGSLFGGTIKSSGSITTEISDSAIILGYGIGGASGGKHIYYEASGFNPPTLTSRSSGTKIVLYPALGATTIDYGIGVENRNVWFTTERATSTYGFKWYGAATKIAELDGSSTFFLQEKSSIAHLPDAGQGAFWIKDDTPNVPYFTDDAGTDYQLAYVGAGVSDFFDSTTAGSIFTTGSAAFRGLESGVDSPLDKGADNFFYVSGSTNSKDSATAGTSLFGGDVVASGTTYFMSSTYIADVAGAGLTTPPQGTDFSPLLVEVNNSGLEYAAHFKNESESIGSAVALGFSNRSGVYNIKGGIVYQSVGTFGRGDIHILQNSAADSSDADITDKVATFYSAGGGEVYGDWKTVSLSGSLTHLDDGSSYLIAGTNVTIVSNSNGSVTISSTASGGGGGSGFFDSTTAGSIFTTGSTAIKGGEPAIDSPSDKGADVFFYVSGSEGSKDSATAGTALFGGDVVVSGTLYGSTFVERQPTTIISGVIQHYGWAVNKMELINAQLFCYTTASQGSYDFTLTKDPDGTPINLLQTSSYDLKTLTEKTPTAVTLTNTGSDLTFNSGDIWMAQFEATSESIDAEGMYFLLNWKIV